MVISPRKNRRRRVRREEVFIALGSNLGRRIFNIKKALRELENSDKFAGGARYPSVKVEKVSSFYRTKPYPGSSGPYYINAAAKIFTTLRPLELLRRLKEIEKKLGRPAKSSGEKIWGEPRTIDIDIIFYGNKKISQKGVLEIPHRFMRLRDFVLKPLAEIAPAKIHPVTGKTALEMLEELPPSKRTIIEVKKQKFYIT